MKITQREARRLRKVERDLNEIKRGWGKEWPEGKCILTAQKGETLNDEDIAIVRTARTLGHPVVVTQSGDQLYFHGIML